VITRDPAVVLVHFAITVFPGEVFPWLDADPTDDVSAWNASLVFPSPYIVDDLVSNLMRNPATV
jgi:hypothetical protein